MSPDHPSTFADPQSEKPRARRGRPPVPRSLVLAAADALFAETDEQHPVSMDEIAAAAGVGKGTVFRAFGSRDNLLDALFASRMAALRAAVESGAPPVGPGAPPRKRALAILDALLTFKLDNRRLIRAREIASAGLFQAGHYQWMHGTLRELIEQATSGAPQTAETAEANGIDAVDAVDPGYAAHVLLGSLRPDLIDELLEAGGTPETIRRAQAALAQRILS